MLLSLFLSRSLALSLLSLRPFLSLSDHGNKQTSSSNAIMRRHTNGQRSRWNRTSAKALFQLFSLALFERSKFGTSEDLINATCDKLGHSIVLRESTSSSASILIIVRSKRLALFFTTKLNSFCSILVLSRCKQRHLKQYCMLENSLKHIFGSAELRTRDGWIWKP